MSLNQKKLSEKAQTIAENIESGDWLSQVSALAANYFQGNYFSKPHQITKLLE